ncbi:hypothetical protein QUF90_08770 [Desulfococcaceae bacterium HSG9]|nr:hypothetical protein [Desulfococcaceae bacterium HSG9]
MSAKIKHSDFLHPKPGDAYGFKGRQKTASLNFCAPCRIFRHFPSTDTMGYGYCLLPLAL